MGYEYLGVYTLVGEKETVRARRYTMRAFHPLEVGLSIILRFQGRFRSFLKRCLGDDVGDVCKAVCGACVSNVWEMKAGMIEDQHKRF